MAVYKVIQNIEAEDKLIGPLGLKGFIYALIALGCAFINFRLLLSGALGPLKWVLMPIFLVPMILFSVLASPLGREQPTEVWLLARLKFWFKPRSRIWDQAGLSQLVTITAPKKVEENLTKNLSQTEVKSRLGILAATLDSRGWAVKDAAVNLAVAPNYHQEAEDDSQRLVAASALPSETQVIDVHQADDILDEQNNPQAQKVDNLMQEAEATRKDKLAQRLEMVRTEAAAAPPLSSMPADIVVSPGQKLDSQGQPIPLTNEELSLLNQVHERDRKLGSEHIIKAGHNLSPNPMTAAAQTAKLELAQSGNDLSVASIAQLASR